MSNNATTTLSEAPHSEAPQFSSTAGWVTNRIARNQFAPTLVYNVAKSWVTNGEDLEKLAHLEDEVRRELESQDPGTFSKIMATVHKAPKTLDSIDAATQAAKEVAESTGKVAKQVAESTGKAARNGVVAFIAIMVVLLIVVIVFKSVAVKQRRDYLKRN